ncbi:MAG: xanthine dehydrogenase family protein molybdopterin-binding subunit [Armatimonadetes bacterium]|nr:xanthine dehydrogenase family protein molybdopterin-binding subunit [Armatimonadota bacterium]MCX7968986.1 xanthine dehydrogenase family protein molybdopterin-binding subunit [Armatimonadota bacterium]MDW8142989.1 xanthine dehydrogenase family protein molybdopterin-binding subunit [Armatimonadota bacterium]
MAAQGGVTGRRFPRLDAVAKVTGQAKYTYDINLPDIIKHTGKQDWKEMLYGKILRCPLPHARVRRIDTSKAEKLSGVRAVLVIAGEGTELRYAGEAVAAVAAVSEEIAEDALRLIEVEYESLPFEVDTQRAYEKGMRGTPRVQRQGRGEEGLSEAEVTVEVTLRTPVHIHTPLEAHGSVVGWEAPDRVVAYDSTQALFSVRDGLARALNISPDRVRAICEYMGGGFGSKLWMHHYTPVAARLSRMAGGVPVKLMLSRKEVFLTTGNNPDSVQNIRIGAKKDGTFVAFVRRAYGTAGVGGGFSLPGPIYRFQHYYDEQTDVFVNAGPGAPFRAPGWPQSVFAIESAIDELARALNMDPLELRLKNDPNEIRQKQWLIGAERIGWKQKWQPWGSQKGVKRRGLGCAASAWGGGGGPGSQPEVRIHPDGRVEVLLGTQDIGTGTKTVVGAAAIEALGLTPEFLRSEKFVVQIGDTRLGRSGTSGGSVTTATVFPATYDAAERALQQLLKIVGSKLNVAPEQLVAKGGRIFVKDNPQKGLSWEEATKLLTEPISARGQWRPGLSGSGVAGAQFAEVEVDTETGKVKVLKVVAVHDCGRVVNFLTAETQVIGGVVMGISLALLEGRVMDRQIGRMLNPNMENYKLAAMLEMPEVEVVFLDMPERGVIGLGEPPVIPTAAAIANAVANALGIRINSLPITPDKVLVALGKAKA